MYETYLTLILNQSIKWYRSDLIRSQKIKFSSSFISFLKGSYYDSNRNLKFLI